MKSKITITKRNFLTFITCCLFALSVNAQAPVVVSTVPVDNATNVNITDLITVTFDQPIQAGISGKKLIIWYYSTSGSTIYATHYIDDFTISGNTIALDNTLPYDTDFFISFEFAFVKNASDEYNPAFGNSNTWFFSTESDTYPPVLSSMSPPDNSVGVYENSNIIKYNFIDGPIQAGSGNIIVRRVDNDAIVLNADVTNSSDVIFTGGSLTIVSTPSTFDYSTEYYVEFPSGVVEDLVGNPFAGIGASPLADHDFTMRDEPDTTAPLVTSFLPADNATNISVSTDLIINFDEDIQIGTGNIAVKSFPSGAVIHLINVTTATISGNTATINIPSNLASNTGYFITMVSGVFQDLVGHDFVGFLDTTTWNFTTVNTDVTPPSASAYSPANNSTGASVSNNLTLTFNEPVQLITDAVLKNYDTNAVIPSSSSVSGNVLTINPTSNLDGNTHYYITLVNGGIQDLAGNNFIGFSTNVTWNFTTVATGDVTPPVPVTFTPADNATGVSITNNLTLLFDETIQLAGNAILLKRIDGTIISQTLTYSGNTLTINPNSSLANNTQYYVEIISGVVQDSAGNSYAGFLGNTTWNFTTEMLADTTPPSVVSFTPLDNATDASISNNLILTFNEDIQISGGRAVLKNYSTNVEIGSSSSTSGNQLIINPTSDLDENTPYYIEILNGIITDLAGNSYAGFSGNSTWNFTTVADGTPPSTIAFIPASGATNSSVSNNLVLGFTENIQISGGRAVLKNFNTNIEIGSSSSAVGNKLYINPTDDLDPNTQYYVEILDGIIQDMAGNDYAGFSGNSTWNFTTGNILATADFELKQHLSIYPNPTTDVLNITISDFNEDLIIEVFDIVGKKVISQKLTETNNQLNISNLTSGIYLLKANSSNKSHTTRIVKK